MSRWFRHYAGMARDDKLVSVAIKSRQSIERVVWVWSAILESAAEIDDDGRYQLDAAEVAYFLRADEADILSVEAALANAGRVDTGSVVKWGNRQFRSDRSAERVAAHRERKRQAVDHGHGGGASQNGAVTLQERHCNSPETELETETDRTLADANVSREKPKSDRQLTVSAFDGVLSVDVAAAVIAHRAKLKKPLTAHAARLLAKQFSLTDDPDGSANLMIARGWQGFDPAWAETPRGGQGPPHRQAKRNTALDDLNDMTDRMFANVQQFPRLTG